MLTCSSCKIPLCQVVYEGLPVKQCPECGGLLVDCRRLDFIKRRRDLRWRPDQAHATRDEAPAGDSAKPRRCPMCLRRMEKQAHSINERVFHVDACETCGVFWFERGELELVQIMHERQEASRTDQDRDRIERRALAEMQLRGEADAVRDEHRVVATYKRSAYLGVGAQGGTGGILAWLGARASRKMAEMDAGPRRKLAVVYKVLIYLFFGALAALAVWAGATWIVRFYRALGWRW